MSKNLRGYSGTQVQINLDEIIANSVTATNGNFTNLTIGTYTITTLNVSDLVASGVVKFTGLTDNSSNQDLQILVRSPTDNRLYHVLNFTINPQSGLITAGALKLLSVSNLPTGSASASYKMLFLHSTGNVYKTQGLEWNEVDDILTTPKLNISNIVTPTTNTDYPILIIDGDEIKKINVTDILYNKSNQSLTAHNIISSNEIYYKSQTLDQRFEPLGGGSGSYVTLTTAQTITGAKTFSALLTATGNLDVGGDAQIDGDLTVDGVVTANIVSADELRIQPIDTTAQPNFLPICMIDTTNQNQIVVDSLTTSFAYNPNANIFKTSKGEFTSNVTIDGTLTVEDNVTISTGDVIISNGDLSIGSLPDASFQLDFDLAFFNPANGKFFKRTGYTLQGTSAVLTLEEVEITNDLTVSNDSILSRTFVTPTSRNNNEDYRIAIIDRDNGQICREQNDTHFFYNTQDNKLTVRNLDVIVSANITGLTFTPTTKTDNIDYELLLYDSTNSTFAIDGNATPIIYNTQDERLTVENINVFNNTVTNYFTLSNPFTWNGDDDNPITFLNPSNRLYTAPSGNPLTYNGNSGLLNVPRVNVSTNATINCPGSTSTANNRIPFIEGGGAIGRLESKGNFFYNQSTETLNANNVQSNLLRLVGANNATLEVNSSANQYGLFMTSNDGFVMREGPNWKLRVHNNLVTVYNSLQVNTSATIDGDITKNTATLSAAPRNMNILFHDNDAGDKRIKEHNLFHFNPSDEKLTVPNLTVSTNIKISPNVPTASTTFPFLLLNTGNNDVKKSDSTLNYNPIEQKLFVKNITLGSLPLNYVTVLSLRHVASGLGAGPAWNLFNVTGAAGEDTEYTGSSTGRQWGFNNHLIWSMVASGGGAPTISQYGANITVGGNGRGAINFLNNKLKLYHIDYAGWWRVDISIFYQNTGGSNRHLPYARLMKQLNGTGSYVEQPQVSQACEYLRYDNGEVSNIRMSGPVYFANTNDAYRIYTLLETGAVGSDPPNWNNETLDYLGLGLNISCSFLGNANSQGETVTAL